MHTSKKIHALAALFTAFLAIPVLALAAPAPAEAPGVAEGVEEIEVVGQRSLLALRMQVEAAQEEVHVLFNDLNTDDDFDIVCKVHDRYFSKMKEKVCMPQYAWDLRQQEGQNFAQKIIGEDHAEGIPANVGIDLNEPRLKEHMIEALRHSPELFDAIVKHATLMQELADAQTTYFGDKK